MFASCTGLTSLDLTNFDTGNEKYMKQMFNNCSSLKILNISNFNTSNVYEMNVYEMFDMFNKCVP